MFHSVKTIVKTAVILSEHFLYAGICSESSKWGVLFQSDSSAGPVTITAVILTSHEETEAQGSRITREVWAGARWAGARIGAIILFVLSETHSHTARQTGNITSGGNREETESFTGDSAARSQKHQMLSKHR